MKRLIISLILLGLVLVTVLVYFQGIQKTISLNFNGQEEEVITSAWTVSEFLVEQGIVLTEKDSIVPGTKSILFGDEEISIQQASWITVAADGSIQSTYNRYATIDDVLDNLSIVLESDDLLYLDGTLVTRDTPLQIGSNLNLQILRTKPFSLTQADSSKRVSSSAPTLGMALLSNGIIIDTGDNLKPSLDSQVNTSTNADLPNSREIQIQLATGLVTSKTSVSTVGEALSEAGISLQGLDYSRPGAGAPIPDSGIIQVIRVQEEQILESEPIPYETETQPVADLEIDNRSLVQPGSYGLMTKRIRVRFEDGVETSRHVEDEYISQQPQSEILGYGTKIVKHTMNTPDGPIQYWRALEMYAVSYNVSSAGDAITATGLELQKGIVAIDPRYIPYGTRMYVPGYGEALAADTGGGIKGRMIDLGYRDEDYVSWHQWVTVYFLWPPPESIAWTIP
jgi:uncharacterized protein YabE (DUF348 family)